MSLYYVLYLCVDTFRTVQLCSVPLCVYIIYFTFVCILSALYISVYTLRNVQVCICITIYILYICVYISGTEEEFACVR